MAPGLHAMTLTCMTPFEFGEMRAQHTLAVFGTHEQGGGDFLPRALAGLRAMKAFRGGD